MPVGLAEEPTTVAVQANPTPQANQEEVHMAVLNMLGSMKAGEGVLALAQVERGVAASLGATSFSNLGHSSLLEVITASSSLLPLAERAVGAPAGAGTRIATSCGSLLSCEEVATQVLQAIPASDMGSATKERLVAKALCSHFRTSSVDELLRLCGGLQEFVHVVEHMAEAGSDGSAHSTITAAAALLASTTPEPAALEDFHAESAGRLGDVDKAAALRCLAAAPALADLLEWSQWQDVFQPSLGPLPDLLCKEETLQPGRIDMRVLATANGRLLKLPAYSSPASFADALNGRDATGTIAELLSVVVGSGSLEQSPREQMIAAAASGLSSLVVEATEGGAADFFLHCLALLPAELRAALAEAVLLLVFRLTVGKQHANRLLASAAVGSQPRLMMLAGLGLALGEEAWSQDWIALWSSSAPAPDAVTKSATASSSDAGASFDSQNAALLPLWLDIPAGQGRSVLGVESEAPTSWDSPDRAPQAASARGLRPRADGSVASDEPSSEQSLAPAAGEVHGEAAAQAVVEDIRKKLGILPASGLDALEPDVQRCLDEYPKLMGRACEKLSSDLYSADNHFVLELIQNADDNDYGPGVEPSLAFIVARSSITLLNNEVCISCLNPVHILLLVLAHGS